MTIAEVRKAIAAYERRFGERPKTLYVSRASRSQLWEDFGAFVGQEEPEPPLYIPIGVDGVAIFALYGVKDDSVDAVFDPRPVKVPA